MQNRQVRGVQLGYFGTYIHDIPFTEIFLTIYQVVGVSYTLLSPLVRYWNLVCTHRPSFRDKHVGLEVCLSAYNRMPFRMLKRLEGLVGGSGHFIGGSVDTMYLPGHLRAEFLDVLGTFLQTECFLEIVSPPLSLQTDSELHVPCRPYQQRCI